MNSFLSGWNHPRPETRRTFRLHLTAAPFEGLVRAGVLMLPVIARKSLGASDLEIMLLTMIAPICFLLSIYWAELIRALRDWRRLFWFNGLLSFTPFLLVYGYGSIPMLLGVAFFYELGRSLHIPLRNRVFQENYQPDLRARLFGIFTALIKITLLLASWPLGRFLDADPGNWRLVFVVLAAAGLADRGIQSLVPLNPRRGKESTPLAPPGWLGWSVPNLRFWSRPLVQMGRLLNRDRQFFRWEMQFMLYGLAFFIIFTLLPGFLVEVLQLSYTWISLGQVALSQLAGALVMPFWGKFHDHTNPARFSAVIFGILFFFPPLLLLSGMLPAGFWRLGVFLLAFTVLGTALSGVMVAWSMSSLVFAGSGDGAHYQSIHVTLTGFRGLAGPLVGWLVKDHGGWIPAFLLAALLLASASLLMWRQGVLLGNGAEFRNGVNR